MLCHEPVFLNAFTFNIHSPSEFISSPENVTVCDPESIPTTFSVSCGYNSFQVSPIWNITGLSAGQFVTLARGQSFGGYLSYTQATAEEARLNIALSSNMMQVNVGTCFQCVLDLLNGRIASEKGCIAITGEKYFLC